eukprot:83312-Chlamydomonas_euryale.AAC.7
MRVNYDGVDAASSTDLAPHRSDSQRIGVGARSDHSSLRPVMPPELRGRCVHPARPPPPPSSPHRRAAPNTYRPTYNAACA